MQAEIEDILYILEDLLSDPTIPRNVKEGLSEVKKKVESKVDIVRLSEAIYILQDISEDVNLPMNSKSDIWMLQSQIEKIKERVK